MRSYTSLTLPCLSLLLLTGHVQADILFSQPVISGGVGLASDFARFQQEADSFSLAIPASVGTIHWWGAYANNDVRSDNFTVRFFTDVGGNPAQTAFVDLSSLSLTRTPTNLASR
jgi:hypothetical protein